MKMFAPIALVSFAFAQAPTGVQTTAGPLAREHWQRTVLPPSGKPLAEQCVVLDADLFANAAPGLRDVRVLQGQRELQYAVDESHDDRETSIGAIPSDDRSIFDVVGVVPLTSGAERSGGEPLDGPGRIALFLLPAHVPVERITLRGALDAKAKVMVRATPHPADSPVQPTEIVDLEAAPGRLSVPVTLGANLQDAADVVVGVTPATSALTAVVFEMRRRELCYKPITDEPVRMVYGDSDAQSIHYDYALHYKPTATPLLATVGPREMNPVYGPPVVAEPFLTLRQKLGVAIGLCVGMIVVTFGALALMLRKQR
jgi:hypothetical protein